MDTERRTVAYIDDSECVNVYDPMSIDPETEEALDQEWLEFSAAQRLQVQQSAA